MASGQSMKKNLAGLTLDSAGERGLGSFVEMSQDLFVVMGQDSFVEMGLHSIVVGGPHSDVERSQDL